MKYFKVIQIVTAGCLMYFFLNTASGSSGDVIDCSDNQHSISEIGPLEKAISAEDKGLVVFSGICTGGGDKKISISRNIVLEGKSGEESKIQSTVDIEGPVSVTLRSLRLGGKGAGGVRTRSGANVQLEGVVMELENSAPGVEVLDRSSLALINTKLFFRDREFESLSETNCLGICVLSDSRLILGNSVIEANSVKQMVFAAGRSGVVLKGGNQIVQNGRGRAMIIDRQSFVRQYSKGVYRMDKIHGGLTLRGSSFAQISSMELTGDTEVVAVEGASNFTVVGPEGPYNHRVAIHADTGAAIVATHSSIIDLGGEVTIDGDLRCTDSSQLFNKEIMGDNKIYCDQFVVRRNGYVGLGTREPKSALHVLRRDNSAELIIEEKQKTKKQNLLRLKHNGFPQISLEDTNADKTWTIRLTKIDGESSFAITRSGTGGAEARVWDDGIEVTGDFYMRVSPEGKEDMSENIPGDVLSELKNLKIIAWRQEGERHDTMRLVPGGNFNRIFGIGGNTESISLGSLGSVGLLSVKALIARTDEMRQENRALSKKVDELQREVEMLRKQLNEN